MANLTESATFDAAVYQLETGDPVLGGAGGVSNSQAQALANRTKYLKAQVDALNSAAAGLAPLNSPTFTGDPKAPTAPLGDKDTSVANTEFVQNTCYGVLNKSVAGGANVTLTAVEAGNGILVLSGVLTASINVIVPAVSKSWIVVNNTTGNYSLTLKTAAGTGVLVVQGQEVFAYCDGVNVSLAGSANESSFAVTQATATAGQTSFPVQYTPGAIIVVKNAAVLPPTDFVATSGSAVVLATGAVVGDKMVFYAFSSFTVADAVMKAGDTMSGPLNVPAGATGTEVPQVQEVVKKSGDTMTGALTLSGNASNALHAVPKQQLDAAIAALPEYISMGTPVASTSGTAIDFTSIPAGTNRITVMFAGVSTNGTSSLTLRLGDSDGIESTGYVSSLGTADGTGFAPTSTTAFLVSMMAAAASTHGAVTLVRLDGNTWLISGTAHQGGSSLVNFASGSKTLTAELDRIRITTAGGTDTFDAGTINISYE